MNKWHALWSREVIHLAKVLKLSVEHILELQVDLVVDQLVLLVVVEGLRVLEEEALELRLLIYHTRTHTHTHQY
jgi:hypothetical protein